MTESSDPPRPAAVSFWIDAARQLLRPQPVPPRWWRAVAIVYTLDALVIVGCIVASLHFYGNTYKEFGEKHAGTFASVGVLIASGVVCFRIRRRVAGSAMASFWLAFGCLLCLSAADDLLEMHERLDRKIHWLLQRDPEDFITDHLDDMIVLLYALPAMYLAFLHRHRLIAARLTIQVLAIAFAIFAIHVVFDVVGFSNAAEESLKLTAGCTILLAFLATLFQPTLPTTWTGAAETRDTPSLTARWVRALAIELFAAMACLLIAALFSLSAAFHHRGTSAAILFRACAAGGAVAAAGLVLVAHVLLSYAARLRRAAADDPQAVAPWRALTLTLGGVLLLGVTATVWASRLSAVPIPPKVHHVHTERDQQR